MTSIEPAVEPGRVWHVMPTGFAGEPEHDSNAGCWCGPRRELAQSDIDGLWGAVYTHHRPV